MYEYKYLWRPEEVPGSLNLKSQAVVGYFEGTLTGSSLPKKVGP